MKLGNFLEFYSPLLLLLLPSIATDCVHGYVLFNQPTDDQSGNENFVARQPPQEVADTAAADYSANLSYLALGLSAVSYAANSTAECYSNSGMATDYGQLANVSQAIVPATVGGATAENTWSGFVGRLPDQRITFVSYRGTVNVAQLVTEFLEVLRLPPVAWPHGGRAQAYFYRAQQAVWSQLESAFERLRSTYPNDIVLIAGHSLGASMAALSAGDLAAKGVRPMLLYTFGEPRVGDVELATALDRLLADGGVGSWRVVNGRDPVVHLPFCRTAFEQCKPEPRTGPYHRGTEVFYPSGMTPRGTAQFRICLGQPKNEDRTCADSPAVFLPCLGNPESCIDAHKHYFGIDVGKWWLNSRCRNPAPRSWGRARFDDAMIL